MFEGRITNLPGARQRRFRDFLDKTIREATEQRWIAERAKLAAETAENGVSDPDSHHDALLPALCATCRGNCCCRGGEHGFLKPADIQQYMDEHPAKRPQQVFQDYLQALPERTYDDSCVFHTEQGCNLPRALVSKKCRRYFCDGLLDFRREHAQQDVSQVVAVSRAGPRIVRTAVVSQGHIELIDLPSAAAASTAEGNQDSPVEQDSLLDDRRAAPV